MPYPSFARSHELLNLFELYIQLKHEQGATDIAEKVVAVEAELALALVAVQALPDDPAFAAKEPDHLPAIRTLRPAGPRTIWQSFNEAEYRRRLEGALLGRFAGCTLGAPVEGWAINRMEGWAREIGDAFPPVDYWSEIPERHALRYGASRCDAYTRDKLDGVPVDDDITYTILGLLIAEDYGTDFTTADVGRAWLRDLPVACTAEHVALENLKRGIPAEQAGETDNPYRAWIGADIRSDPWGYLAPGLPEKAAKMAWHDAYLSHRRAGIHGEMYFSAVIAAAFTVDDPVEALRLGLAEIPADCTMAETVRWALEVAPSVTDYRKARALVDERFAGMSIVHTLNNACLTIWGLTLGGTDFTRVIGETVAMGLDNDCTAATAGSIAGAVIGKDAIPPHWTARFNNTVRTYINGHPRLAIDDVVERFTKLTARTFDV
ncbi:MAG: ADP-ribosylglycohydrolase family protein [Armatimonadota bacterium]